MLKYDYKDATPEKKQEMLQSIASHYKMSDKSQVVQALAHCQAVFDCTQDEFAKVAKVAVRTLRFWKNRDYPDLYEEAYEKYAPEPELVEVEVELEEDALEAVYQNLLSRLQNPKTATKDLATILQYFGIQGQELRAYAQVRNQTMRGFVRDNDKTLIQDEESSTLAKSIISESHFLYRGTPASQGNTANAMTMNLNESLVRMELMTFGMLFVCLFNGNIVPQFKEYAETLRLLKLVSGDTAVKPNSNKEYDRMDGKEPALMPISPKMEQELINVFGKDEGKHIYEMLTSAKRKVDKKTELANLPKYEQVVHDYAVNLKEFPELAEMPIEVMFEKLDAENGKSYQEKYKEFLTKNEEETE
ncbi:MAG: hypothetical protein ABF629_10505 [Sporolactobacillus sp.]